MNKKENSTMNMVQAKTKDIGNFKPSAHEEKRKGIKKTE